MYASPYFLNWLATQVAGQALTVTLHTGEPGNDGTANRATNNGGTQGVQETIAASGMTATGDTVDNDSDVAVFTPNATSAGQTITHVGYWFGTNFLGWAPLASGYTTIAGTPVTIPAGMTDIMFALGS